MTLALMAYAKSKRAKKAAPYFFAGLLLDALFLMLLAGIA